MVFPVVAPILGGLAAYLTGLGTKVADEVAMHPIKQGVKALYGDNKPKKQGLAQQMMAPQPQFQSSDPANALAGQLSMPQQQAQPQQQMTQAAEGAGGGLFGDYFSNADNPVRHGLGNAIASIIAINQGQNPFQTIEARNRSQLQRQQVKQQQEQYQQEQQQKQQQLQIDQQNRQEDIANRKSELQQNNAFKQQQFQYGQQQDQLAAQREDRKLQMEQSEFNAKMGIEQSQLKIQQQEAARKEQEAKQAQENAAALFKGMFPQEAGGAIANGAGTQGLTPEQTQALKEAWAVDPSGKTAVQMHGQMIKDANAPPTEAQSKARVNYDILERNLPEVDRTEKAAFQHGMTGDYALGKLPMDAGKFMQSKEYRQYQGAIMNWVQQLYFARSGQAAPESEVARGMQIYAVQPWDDAVTAQNKVERRRRMVESLKMGMAPKSADPFEVDQQPQQQQQIQDGATAVNPQTGQRIRLQGGQWVPVQ